MTINNQTIADEIRAYLIAEFHPEGRAEEIAVDIDLMNSGIVDSLGLLKLIAWLEHQFSITVGDADLDPENFSSIQAITKFVISHQGDQA